MKGQQDCSSYSYEIGGVVSSTGSGVSTLSIGDRVICLHAGRFDSSFHVPQTMCHKLRDEENYEDVVGFQMSSCAALHALRDTGRLAHGEVRDLYLTLYRRDLTPGRGCSSTEQEIALDMQRQELHSSVTQRSFSKSLSPMIKKADT
jgi:hypothetical protein